MIDLDYGVKLVTRAEWGARAPRSTTSLSVDTVTSHWEGPHMGPFPHSSCAAKVRGIQNFHMDSRGWTDIAYNALACPHGYVFEGRGRGKRSAANGTTAGNSGAYAICYLGGQGDPFTEDGKRAMKAGGNWLTRAGSRRNGHRDWKSTECPGNDIYSWTHAGQPITGVPTQPPQTRKDDKMYAFIQGDVDRTGSGAVYLTDMMVKRHMRDPQELAGFQYALAIGGAIVLKNGQVDVWNQSFVDAIPSVAEIDDTYALLRGSPSSSTDRLGDLWNREGEILGKVDHVIEMLHAEEPPNPPA